MWDHNSVSAHQLLGECHVDLAPLLEVPGAFDFFVRRVTLCPMPHRDVSTLILCDHGLSYQHACAMHDACSSTIYSKQADWLM